MMNYFKALFLISALSMSFGSSALDALDLKTRTNYPKEMKTVYEAVKYVLEPIEYELVIISEYAPDAYKISAKPITPMARTARTMTIYDAIQALIGVENTIVVDHENKLVSFLKGVHSNQSIIENRGK